MAFLIGLIFAQYVNNDKFHSLLRRYSFTVETSHPSVWYAAFSQNKTYVVVHLKDGRRLYGWPKEWPSQPNTGHFSLVDVEWLDKSINAEPEVVSNILIPADEVTFVEFMELNKNTLPEKQGE